MDELAPVLMSTTLFVVIGTVLLLRPITKRLGDLLEAIALEKKRGQDSADATRLRETISAMESRIALLEERQNFTESLLTNSNHRAPVALGNELRVRELQP